MICRFSEEPLLMSGFLLIQHDDRKPEDAIHRSRFRAWETLVSGLVSADGYQEGKRKSSRRGKLTSIGLVERDSSILPGRGRRYRRTRFAFRPIVPTGRAAHSELGYLLRKM